MFAPDVSILIVHTFEKHLVRQALRGLRRAAPQLFFEVIVIDNNPAAGVAEMLRREFPSVRYFARGLPGGFGAAMNVGMKHAKGKYIFVMNPDIIVSSGSLEGLRAYMDEREEIGILGPKLLNADGSLQYSCYRYPRLLTPLMRRTPFGLFGPGKRMVDNFLMKDADHEQIQEVDWLMGSALFVRRTALASVGLFDERFFLYFEDTDWCRRFWEKGYKIVYYPRVAMVHYHRRASADGSFFQQLLSLATRRHLKSAMKYFRKYWGKPHPREHQLSPGRS